MFITIIAWVCFYTWSIFCFSIRAVYSYMYCCDLFWKSQQYLMILFCLLDIFNIVCFFEIIPTATLFSLTKLITLPSLGYFLFIVLPLLTINWLTRFLLLLSVFFLPHMGFSFWLVDFSFVNSLLLNSLNSVHPPLIYAFLLFLFILILFSFCFFFTRTLNQTAIFYFQLLLFVNFAIYVFVFTLFLGGFWAFQVTTWGGWWVWDFSEALLLLYLIPPLFFSHLKITLSSWLMWLRVLFLTCFFYILCSFINIFLITTTLHSFFSPPSSLVSWEAALRLIAWWALILILSRSWRRPSTYNPIQAIIGLELLGFQLLIFFFIYFNVFNRTSYCLSLLVVMFLVQAPKFIKSKVSSTILLHKILFSLALVYLCSTLLILPPLFVTSDQQSAPLHLEMSFLILENFPNVYNLNRLQLFNYKNAQVVLEFCFFRSNLSVQALSADMFGLPHITCSGESLL